MTNERSLDREPRMTIAPTCTALSAYGPISYLNTLDPYGEHSTTSSPRLPSLNTSIRPVF